MTKKRSHKLIVALIITLTILLIAGISFFSKSNKENQMERSSPVNAKNNCSNCKKEISMSDKFCSFCGGQINYQGVKQIIFKTCRKRLFVIK